VVRFHRCKTDAAIAYRSCPSNISLELLLGHGCGSAGFLGKVLSDALLDVG
jgi:hypothetical protein